MVLSFANPCFLYFVLAADKEHVNPVIKLIFARRFYRNTFIQTTTFMAILYVALDAVFLTICYLLTAATLAISLL